MTPSYAMKRGVRYRYYVSCVLAQGRKADAGSVPRVAAGAVERAVLDAVAARDFESDHAASGKESRLQTRAVELPVPNREPGSQESDTVVACVDRVLLGSRSLEIRFREGADRPAEVVSIPWSPQTFRRKREVIQPSREEAAASRPIRAEARMKLLSAIAKGRRWLDELVSGVDASVEAIAARESISERSARMGLSLAFLAPDIIQAAVDGTLPRGLGVSRLTDLPPNWDHQRKAIGL